MKTLGRRIKLHEENIKYLKTQINSLDDSILDLHVMLGKYHSARAPVTEGEDVSVWSEEETLENILKHEKSAASILCHLKTSNDAQAIPLTKDVLGIVALLGKVYDENLSRLLSEYLGLETMMAIVCTTIDGMKVFETYDKKGSVNKDINLHGLAASIGRPLEGKFTVSCLETLRTKAEMLQAHNVISHGALSLDGGIMKSSGVFRAGSREDLDVKFAICSGTSYLPDNYAEIEQHIENMKWKKEFVVEDLKRQEAFLVHVRYCFNVKQQEFIQFLPQSSPYPAAQSAPYPAQPPFQAAKGRRTSGLFNLQQ